MKRLCGLTDLVELDNKLYEINEPMDERDPIFLPLQQINDLRQSYRSAVDSLEKQLILINLIKK